LCGSAHTRYALPMPAVRRRGKSCGIGQTCESAHWVMDQTMLRSSIMEESRRWTFAFAVEEEKGRINRFMTTFTGTHIFLTRNSPTAAHWHRLPALQS